ncbi:MAG: hypothetical protein ACR2FY_01690 [Pirellulaceae bacterium]
MPATKNDLTRLIQFSLDKPQVETAFKAFGMFKRDQIKSIYSMSRRAREKLLKQRRIVDPIPIPKQYRNREQAQKMADIATDPSNR